MKEVDYRNEIGVVYCDANKCNKTLDVNSKQYSEINYEMKENGWLVRKIYENWYDFCSEECYYKTIYKLLNKKGIKGDNR